MIRIAIGRLFPVLDVNLLKSRLKLIDYNQQLWRLYRVEVLSSIVEPDRSGGMSLLLKEE